MAFKPYCAACKTWHAAGRCFSEGEKLARGVGLDVEDGLVFTYSSADYPAWVLAMNGWPVEDAAREIRSHADAVT